MYLFNNFLKNEKIKKPLKIIFVGFDFRTSLPDGDYKIKKEKISFKVI